jgi:hypothetical protein
MNLAYFWIISIGLISELNLRVIRPSCIGGKLLEFSLGLLISIAITIYLVIDAPKHNKSPVLWGILGFILGLLGLGIYLIVTDRKVLGWIIVALFIILVIIVILFFAVIVAMFVNMGY